MFVRLLIVFALICLLTGNAHAQNSLSAADSLFDMAAYSQAYTLYRQAMANEPQPIAIRNRMAESLLRLGKTEESFRFLQETLPLCQNNADKSLTNNTLSLVFLQRGQADLALETCWQALKMAERLPEPHLALTADCYNNLAIIYWTNGNQTSAQDYHRQALALRAQTFGETHPTVAASYNNIGLLHAADDPKTAANYYNKALIINSSVYGENHPTIAVAYINLAVVQKRQAAYQEAVTSINKALGIWQKLYGEQHPSVAFAYAEMGNIYEANQLPEKALVFQTSALHIYRQLFGAKNPEIAAVYNSIARLHRQARRYQEALDATQQAICANLPNFHQTDYRAMPTDWQYYNANILLQSLLLKAQTLEDIFNKKTPNVGHLKCALQALEACDTLIARLRISLNSKTDKIALGETAALVYENAIRICLSLHEGAVNKKGYREKAFVFSEKSKSAVLLSAIADTEAKSFAGIPAELLGKEQLLLASITETEQLLAQNPNPAEEQLLRKQLFDANRAYNDFIAGLEQQFPQYYNLKYNTQTTDVASVQQKLPHDKVMLSYFIAEKSNTLYIFILSANNFEVQTVLFEPEIFNSLVVGFRNSIIYDVPEEYIRASKKLFAYLFPAGLPDKKYREMLVIADGMIGKIPFEALLWQHAEAAALLRQQPDNYYAQFPFLLNRFAVSYAFSATLWAQAAQTSNRVSGRQALLLAPVTRFANAEWANALPDSRQEVARLSAICTAQQIGVQTFTEENASEVLLKTTDLTQYDYIHLATHGVVDETHPDLSAILLAATPNQQDGMLYAGEIYNLVLGAKLVALSACETGLGKISRGEGMIGLSRALTYAGADNLLVSLWSVADASTSQLMITFYQNHLADKSLAFAPSLQAAKRRLIANKQFAAPFYWAPFILMGN